MGNLESFTNPNGGVTTYTYDKNQNVTSESVGDYYKVNYAYDEAGNVKTMTNSRGQVTSYEYDKADRVIRQSDEAGTITYEYDANGLYYMRARYYNIDIMRFINQDILTGSIDSNVGTGIVPETVEREDKSLGDKKETFDYDALWNCGFTRHRRKEKYAGNIKDIKYIIGCVYNDFNKYYCINFIWGFIRN